MRRLLAAKCTGCGNRTEEFGDVGIGCYVDPICNICGGRLQRIASFFFHRSMPEHYNNATGTYVNNERNFKDDLKRKSEEATIRTGMEHNFVPVDLREKEALGVTDEGLHEQTRRLHDTGEVPLKSKTIVTP